MQWMFSKPAKMVGGCRGRTYGPLIKREKEPFLEKLVIAYLTKGRTCLS